MINPVGYFEFRLGGSATKYRVYKRNYIIQKLAYIFIGCGNPDFPNHPW